VILVDFFKTIVRRIKSYISKIISTRSAETEKEYSKRTMNWVLKHCIFMMWCSYVLALLDRVAIAESLSETIAKVIVGTVISYFASKTFENVNKYGSRLNHTALDQDTTSPIEPTDEHNEIIVSTEDDDEGLNIDC
jgi:hypothetical protein